MLMRRMKLSEKCRHVVSSNRKRAGLARVERQGQRLRDAGCAKAHWYAAERYRLSQGLGLTGLHLVAVGAEEPLAEHMMVADFFRK